TLYLTAAHTGCSSLRSMPRSRASPLLSRQRPARSVRLPLLPSVSRRSEPLVSADESPPAPASSSLRIDRTPVSHRPEPHKHRVENESPHTPYEDAPTRTNDRRHPKDVSAICNRANNAEPAALSPPYVPPTPSDSRRYRPHRDRSQDR